MIVFPPPGSHDGCPDVFRAALLCKSEAGSRSYTRPMWQKASCWLRVVGIVSLVIHFATMTALAFQSNPGLPTALDARPAVACIASRAGPARNSEAKPQRLCCAATSGRILSSAEPFAGRHPLSGKGSATQSAGLQHRLRFVPGLSEFWRYREGLRAASPDDRATRDCGTR